MKLTKPQRLVLERLEDGDEAWTLTGRNAHCFWLNNFNDRSPGFPTLAALARHGFIASYETERGMGHKYRITEAGRTALI